MKIKTGKGSVTLVVLLAIWSVSAIASLPGLAVSPILGDLNKVFPKVTDLEIQMLTSLPSLLIIPFVLLSGKLSEGRDKLKILIVGLSIFFLSGVACLFARSMAWLIVISCILGIGAGMVIPFSTGLVVDYFTGDYRVRRLMMLSVTVHSVKGDTTYRALNDAVVSGAQSRIYDFGFSVDGSKLYKFRADGLILATPAGSTAYSLSAGGPVVDPESECVIFTPICPHALFNRSTLFCADKTITVSTDSDYSGEVYLTIDGGAPIRIHKTDTVSVSRSTYYTELIQTDERNFYDIVDSKFMQSRN